MPTPIDIAFAILFTVAVSIFDAVYFIPRFKAKARAGVLGARLHMYRRTIAGQWAFAIAAIFLWMRAGRAWSSLGVVLPGTARLVVSAAIIVLIVALAAKQTRSVNRATRERRDALRPQLAYVEYLLPHSGNELRWFIALSITAGFCEELLYRGFLLWLLAAYIGTALAALAGVVLFGVLHLYQGRQGAVKAGVAGAIMTLIYFGTGWLFPAMVVHALIDVSGGLVGFAVLGEPLALAAELS